ncbi:NAD-dependent epimerase/dehydratase family protein [Sinorhizobium medicae]|uniref:NAD-dependent epimerase/dehydratase family protein n=1 Tax=Sinorhizobium medicae TaxID=110321 RepID=UPI00036E02C1|nr:NAD-dependent epimerase/dehydratase family protein [Sinorhizobium medicae]MDX0994284.1 NAD-dependent epimerase/dehydratase family protein [Sinorhizobium medicae]MDX1122861.1 NAD-dependent epimerase/dehydratase family protein [Sinorhizobium medicae]MDX1178144.1 NAD-dependent epimerase/dehydratase family protein [Sinorhizobium medicae]MDX1226248.1 NAD-dependent epimerase/dehydratase family protein [Sinorhizobium medicae]UFX04848.1 NAD-dependent epimerase/dehydratase family protein [Sinorhizob
MAKDADQPTILITGSSGFLGQAIAHRLRDRYRVIGLDLSAPKRGSETEETIKLDITSDTSVREAIETARKRSGGRIASVIHLAAYYDTTGKDNPKYDAVNVDGTRRLLKALQDLPTEQFIYASTLLVQAPSPAKGTRIDENSPLDPAWAYPKSKAETEAVIAKERGAIRTVILRLAGVYDEDCRAAFIAQQIARIFERLPTAYLFSGDLEAGQPYLHKDDLVEAFVRAVDRRDELPDDCVFLIGEEETFSYGELQKRIGRLVHGEDWRTLSLPKSLAKPGAWMQTEVLDQDSEIKPWMIENSDDHYEIDISRARSRLGWQPMHSLGAILPEMIRRLKQDPTDWYAKNKLEPSVVAASEPEIERAEKRLAQPLERGKAEVQAAVDEHRLRTLWAPLANVALGLWLVASPMTLGLFDPVSVPVPPALGHEVAEPVIRNSRLATSEILSGLLVAVFALSGMYRRWSYLQWITAALGVWIMLAPLVFWTTSAAAYAIDTLAGMLIVAFAVMIPPTPGIGLRALSADDDRPLGWSYSPSSFTQRMPIVALAFVGLFVSRYLAAYQMGHVDGLWDPFFGPDDAPVRNGSEAVVTSWVSKGFPIADAGLGAFAYALDVLAGAIGDSRRWRTMPWMVLLFGLLVVPLGAVSVSFIIIQPPLIGALCTLCIIQAAVTVVLIPYSIDEVLATTQYLWRATKAGEPFWRTFWKGGPALSEDQTPSPDLNRPASELLKEFVTGGVNFPWTLVASVLLGAALMITPVFFGTSAPLYHSDHVLGCVVILVAVTAMAEVVRPVRFLNVVLGAWVAASPLLLDGDSAIGTLADVAMGLALIALSLPRGTRSEEHYGGWDRAIV